MRFDRLDGEAVRQTIATLEGRIASRFPDRNLRHVAAELSALAVDVAKGAHEVQDRLRIIRVTCRALSLLLIAATVVVLALASRDALSNGPDRAIDWVPLIESTINDVVFAGVGLFFLLALPQRLQRGELLSLLHRLRSLAHVIDMHQLTKDPERLRAGYTRTSASVEPGLDRQGMQHYLEYCSELLSLVGKVAALCAEESQDSIVLETVSDLENLTTGMSRKIWQKISLLPS